MRESYAALKFLAGLLSVYARWVTMPGSGPTIFRKEFPVARMRIRNSQSFDPKTVAEMRSLCDSDRADHIMAVRLGVNSLFNRM